MLLFLKTYHLMNARIFLINFKGKQIKNRTYIFSANFLKEK